MIPTTQQTLQDENEYNFKEGEVLKFNIGGRLFAVLKETLTQPIKKLNMENEDDENGNDEIVENNEYYEPNMLSAIASGMHTLTFDKDGSIFIDRDGKYFGYILNYLRASGIPNHFSLPKDEHAIECIYLEAQYYNIQGLIEFIEQEHENWIEHLKPKNFILSNRQPFKDSKILTNQMEGKLVNLLSKTRSFKNCKLLFRASQDGFNASQFHSKCDNKGPTVTIIKTFNNCIFGGYTPLSWNTSDSFQRDNSSFLFSFIGKNEEERNVRIENQGQKDNTKSIYCGSLYGPTFGGGHDLYVDFTSNYSNLGHSYSLNGIAYATSQAQGFLAGSYHFSISELEVYELK